MCRKAVVSRPDFRCNAANVPEVESRPESDVEDITVTEVDAEVEGQDMDDVRWQLRLKYTELPKSRVQWEVEVPQPLVARFWDIVLDELRKKYQNIPGYRPQDKVHRHAA